MRAKNESAGDVTRRIRKFATENTNAVLSVARLRVLEDHLQGELNLPRLGNRAINLTSRRERCFACGGRTAGLDGTASARDCEAGMIQQVEHLSAEFELG